MRRNRSSHYLFGMVLTAVLLSIAFAARGQTIPAATPTPIPSPTPSLEKEFFKNILRDQKAIWTAPLRLDRTDAKWMVPSFIGTGALMATDRITGDEVAELNLTKASRVISYAGSVYTVAGVAGTFYLVGRIKKNDRARETGILTAEAALNSVIVDSALKGISQRVRPQDGEDRSEFFDGGSSFPSGHAILAWSTATVIANEYNDRPVVQVAAYSIATAVSIVRFTGEEHYLSDVLVGSALGYGIGKYVYTARHRKKVNSTDDDSGLTSSRWPAINPRFNRGAREYGIGLTWSF